MKTIYKYEIPREAHMGVFKIFVPGKARALFCAMQRGVRQMWCEIDVSQPPGEETFVIVGTGHPVPRGARYVGSFLEDPFVWHIYQAEQEGEGNGSRG